MFLSMKREALPKTAERHNLTRAASIMDRVTDSGRIMRYFDLLYEEVRQYLRMLSQFFRRLFGLRVREVDYECDADVNACESQSSCAGTKTTYDVITSASSQDVDVNFENEHDKCTFQCLLPHPTWDDCHDGAGKPESEDVNVSLYVNFDASEFPLNDQEAHQQGTDENHDDTDMSTSVSNIASESELSESDLSFTTSDSTGASGQVTVNFGSSYVPQPMLFFDRPLKGLVPDWGPPVGPGKKLLELLRHTADGNKGHLPNVKKEADIPLPDDDVDEWSGRDVNDSLHPEDVFEKNARKSTSQESTSTAKKGNQPLRSPTKISCIGKPDQCHQMLGVPPSEATDVVHTNAPPPQSGREGSPEENRLFKFQAKPKKNVWAKVEPKFTMANSFNKEPTETNYSMNDPMNDSLNNSMNYSMNESNTSETNADISILSQDGQIKQKYMPKRAQFTFRPRSDFKTKDKYTYTFETYSTLSKCKILKCQLGRFEQEYCNSQPSDPSPTQFCFFTPLVRHKAVLAKPEHDVTIEPHFDLSCLDNEVGGFLYEAPCAFERAAYRMDDQIVPEHCKKGTRVSQNEKVKVKRRGVPNKHLLNKKKDYEYVLEVPEKEADAVDGEACDVTKQIDAIIHENEIKVKDNEEDKVEVRKISPRMDFRHYEGVPVAVVQKKKRGDDIEDQYAVTTQNKKKNKNKNKKKTPKNQEKENSTCENIRTALLGGDTSRNRGRNRLRYN